MFDAFQKINNLGFVLIFQDLILPDHKVMEIAIRDLKHSMENLGHHIDKLK